MTTCQTKLVLQGISHFFDDQCLFDDLHLTVAQGKVIAIVGASGVGKSTLFHIIAGLLQPTAGRLWIDQKERTGQAGFVGYMPQKDLLLPFKSVYDNIALPLILQNKHKSIIAKTVLPLLPDFGLLGLEHKYPHTLSGGQKQRAALLRTYLSNNALMLLDEPFSALDFINKQEMYRFFVNFQKNKQPACLIITHDIDEALSLANEIYVLKGKPAYFSRHFVVPNHQEFHHSKQYLLLKQEILASI